MMGWGRRSGVDEREERLAHIRLEADRLVEEGVEEREALRQARARFGRDETLEATTTRWGLTAFEFLERDVRHAVRRLAAAPLTTATILASLTIGIGVNTAIFSLADQALVRPMPVPNPDGVVQLSWEGQWIGEGRGWGKLLPHPLFTALAEQTSVFASLAARSPGEVTLITPAGPERNTMSLVTGSFFEVMGIRPHLGRLIDERDDQILGGHPVAVLSHSFWRTRYDADPNVVGRELRVNGEPLTIIGVAPEGFHGTDWSRMPAAWTSMMMNDLVHAWGDLDQPRVRFQHLFGRLADGVSRDEAQASLAPWFERYRRIDMEHPSWPADREEAEVAAYLDATLAVLPGRTGDAERTHDLTEPLLILSAATALLLLLACLNVANLTLARAVTRNRDTAVRTALGASRVRIVVERLVESGLLAVIGCGFGIVLAPLVSAWILRYFEVGGDGMALHAGIDGRMLGVAVGTALVATVLSGVGPAWFAASTPPMGALRTQKAGAGIRIRRALVVGQVALALVLLVGAGLFGSTLSTLRGQGPGFATDQLITFELHPGNDGFSVEESKGILEEVRSATARIPGVEHVGLSWQPMLRGSGWGNNMLVGNDERTVTDTYLPMNAVTPGFFDALDVDVLRGRGFDSRDRAEPGEWRWDVAIVSQSFVDRFLGGEEPLGLRIDFARDLDVQPRMEIVGVVEDYAEQRLRDPDPQVYFPFDAHARTGGAYYLRASAPLAAVTDEIRRRVSDVSPALTVSELRTLDEEIDRLLVFERMLSAIGGAFATFGIGLAMIGIYGVLSFMVQARRREVGIRMALGAPRASASRLVVGDALRLTLWGFAMALPTIWLLGRWIESWLYGVSATEPTTLLSAVAIVLAVCVGASVGPATRMARTPPTEAFRAD